ncbi:late embryogenesis abundant protein D-34-like [Humulus lupulus]|uniref:late embryogenesis abundant protein D-34-like n=1 Tax=Humulus lupulus TaxID=3486 RepID=UPI002B40E7F1|nr:late embryogenesis abundant protein D-34-like [Humulus lupulus]
MSQEQPQRPQSEQEPIKYGDVFNVPGKLVEKPIVSLDISMIKAAVSAMLGQTQKSGPAGVVGHVDVSDLAGAEGVAVTEVKTDVPGYRIATKSVICQYDQPTATAHQVSAITIGEVLETTGKTIGDKAVDQNDAAAIQAAEARVTGSKFIIPGGLADMAQSAASINRSIDLDRCKIKLGEVLKDATTKLPVDKAATRQDAEGVVNAELWNNPNQMTQPGGVAASVKAAARLNETAFE